MENQPINPDASNDKKQNDNYQPFLLLGSLHQKISPDLSI